MQDATPHSKRDIQRMSDTNRYPAATGTSITIRPIRLKDMEMEAEFVRQLSPQTRHYRFLGAVRELSPSLLRQFCDVDGRHSMAFVATIKEEGRETEIGVSRYAPSADTDVREMAVTVADGWQKKGLGTRLARQLIKFAKGQGVRRLYSVDLADNSAMHELAIELGMSAAQDPDDAHQIIYSLNL